MNLTYILLASTVVVALFLRNRKLILGGMVASAIAGLYEDIITPMAIVMLIGFGELIFMFKKKYKNLHLLLVVLIFLILLCLVGAFSFHMMPGFHNLLVANKLKLSGISCPFSLYLNFDKVMVALILYIFSNLPEQEKPFDLRATKETIWIILICIICVMIPSILSSYVRVDFKIPDITWVWMINNLLFVSFSEEILFRGILQNFLKRHCYKYFNLPYAHIIITAMLFGIAHYAGGIVYIGLAAIAGIFYGYAYDRTGRLFSSMLVHFCLNTSHFLFFTYPVYFGLCNFQ